MNQESQILSDQSDPTGGFSNKTLLLISLNGITIIVIALIFLCQRSPRSDEEDNNIPYDQALQEADVSLLNRAQRRARAKLLMKKNRRLVNDDVDVNVNVNFDDADPNPHAGALVALQDAAVEADDDDDNDGNFRNIRFPPIAAAPRGPQLSRKERQKAAKELERMERKANDDQIRLQKQHQEEDRQIRTMLQLEKKQQAEIEKKEQQGREFREWKYMFPEADLDTKVTVKEFVEELDVDPVISLRETAEEFNVTIDALVDRLEQLEKEGRICHGILNKSRDEFIYISPANMVNIAAFIQEKGAVTIGDLKRSLPQIIDDARDDCNGDQELIELDSRDKKNQ